MTRFELWKDWYKHCLNNPVYKFLVLIRLIRSPSFEMHQAAIEKFSQHSTWKYSVRDEKPEKTKEKSDINWGWYAVYILMVVINAIICSIHDFDVFTWQYWVYFWILVLCFVSGANYRKQE